MAQIAYFDESGNPRTPSETVFAIGGCVASCEQWEEFDRQWRRALSDNGVSCFHTVEIKHPHHHLREPYLSWPQTRRDEFMNRLLDIIDTNGITPVGTEQRLPPADARHDIDYYYYAHYRTCLLHAALLGHLEKVHFVFARQQEISGKKPKEKEFTDYHGLVVNVCLADERWRGRLGSIVVDTPQHIPALQAADLVTYALARKVRRPNEANPEFDRLMQCRSHFYNLG